jgi:HEAT repeat protein
MTHPFPALGFTLLLLLAGFPGCGGEPEVPDSGLRDAPSEDRARMVRPPLDLPAGPASPTAKISFYLHLLEAGDVDRLNWAWDQLSRTGDAAGPLLSAELAKALGKNPFYAENLLVAVARGTKAVAAVDAILASTRHTDGRVRLAAARALGALGAKKGVPALLDLLDDPLDVVARAAVEALEQIGTEECVRGLLGRYPDHVNALALAASAAALAELLPEGESRGFLRSTLQSEDPVLALSAARAMLGDAEELPPPDLVETVRERMRAMRDASLHPRIAYAATEVLAITRDPATLDLLLELASGTDPATARDAVRLLGRYEAGDVRKVLWKLASATQGDLRREALMALYRSGEEGAVSGITGLLASPKAADRYDAALLLGLLRDPETSPAISAALERENDLNVLLKLAHALALIGRPEDAAAVVRVLVTETETDPGRASIAFNAAVSLRRFPSVAEGAETALVEATSSPNPAIRMNAASVLGYQGGSAAARGALVRLLRDPSADVRRVAVRAWLWFPDSDADTAREVCRSEPEEDIARSMAECVEQLLHRWGEL